MDIREEPGKQDGGPSGVGTGVLFAVIGFSIILVVVLGCVGNKHCRKNKRAKPRVEHGS